MSHARWDRASLPVRRTIIGMSAPGERCQDRVVGGAHAVIPLELFFDLVFVFALMQVTTLLADDRARRHPIRGFCRPEAPGFVRTPWRVVTKLRSPHGFGAVGEAHLGSAQD